jgi:hypothetical protein
VSWTTPRTWVAGEVVTATLLNAQVRDNLRMKAGRVERPSARVFRSTTWTHNGSPNSQSIEWNSAAWDYADMWESTSNPHRLTIPTGADGRYEAGGTVEWDSSTAGVRGIEVAKNSSDNSTGKGVVSVQTVALPRAGQDITVNTLVNVAAGDYLVLNARHNSTGTRTLADVPGLAPAFWIAWESAV